MAKARTCDKSWRSTSAGLSGNGLSGNGLSGNGPKWDGRPRLRQELEVAALLLELLDALVQQRVDVPAASASGRTRLHPAAPARRCERVATMLRNVAIVATATRRGERRVQRGVHPARRGAEYRHHEAERVAFLSNSRLADACIYIHADM